MTHLKLSLEIDQVDSLLQLGKFLKFFHTLQSLSLLVDVRVIQQGHLEKVLQNLPFLRYLELTVQNNYDAAVCNNLLEFSKLKQLQSLMLKLSFDCANATRLLSALKNLINLEILFVHIDSYNSTDTKELLLGIQEVHSLKKLTLSLYLRENTNAINIDEVAKALSSLRLLLINLSVQASFVSSGENGVIELRSLWARTLDRTTRIEFVYRLEIAQ